MKHIKSERLKKLELEYNDLQQWLKLGLVPKKDVEKHKEEIVAIQSKIEEEKERLQFLKESGEAEEYITPKRPTVRTAYTEMPTIPDIDIAETGGLTEGFDMETDAIDVDSSIIEEREEDDEEGTTASTAAEEAESEEEDDEESYFSDRNRWRRGGIVDPDANDW